MAGTLLADLRRWGSLLVLVLAVEVVEGKEGWNVRRQERWAGLVCL
jgi:hypothetical protein